MALRKKLMFYFLLNAAVCGFFILSCTKSATENKLNNNSKIEIKTDYLIKKLKNGLTVILIENKTAPIVSYQTFFRVGSKNEKQGERGIAHLFEHLMFNKKFDKKLESLGSSTNAYTNTDVTVYHEAFYRDYLEEVMGEEVNRLLTLELSEKRLKNELKVVLEEKRKSLDNNPFSKLLANMWKIAYPNHPYAVPIIGFNEDLESLTVPQLVEFYKSYYQPQNMILVISGFIDKNKTFELVKKYYKDIKAQEIPKIEFPKFKLLTSEKRMIYKDDVEAEKMIIAYRIPYASHDDIYALDLLAEILFSGESSPAYQQIVEKDLAQNINGFTYALHKAGLFVIFSNQRQNVRSNLIESELAKIFNQAKEQYLNVDRLEKAKRKILMQIIRSTETAQGVGEFAGTTYSFFNEFKGFEHDLKKYQNVQIEDLVGVYEKYIKKSNKIVVMVEPK